MENNCSVIHRFSLGLCNLPLLSTLPPLYHKNFQTYARTESSVGPLQCTIQLRHLSVLCNADFISPASKNMWLKQFEANSRHYFNLNAPVFLFKKITCLYKHIIIITPNKINSNSFISYPFSSLSHWSGKKKKAAFQIDVFKLGFKRPHLYFAIISHTSPTIWRITPASRSVLYRWLVETARSVIL